MYFKDTIEDPADLTNAHYRAIGECTCMGHNSSCITTQQQQETVNIPATTDYTYCSRYTDKKEYPTFFICKKIQNGAVQSHI